MVTVLYIYVVILFTFIFFCTRWLIKRSVNTFDGLDNLKTQCLEINTKEELQECWKKFKQLQKQSFHKHHYHILHEIYGILEAKHHDYIGNNAANN
jgi:hypothetical protein